MTARSLLSAATLLSLLAAPHVASAQVGRSRVFGELLKRIPDQSNALLLVNVDGLFDSPIGRRENWRQNAIENNKDRIALSAEISKVAVAVGMDIDSLEERWKVGLIQLRSDVPIKLEAVAAREGGYVESIENTPVAWTPRNFYLFDFPDKLVGFVSPTNRKGLIGWLRSSLVHPRAFPPGFADRAIFRADAGAQVVLALDLSDALSAKMIEPWLNSIEGIKKTNSEPKLIAPRLASAKSAFIAVTADQNITGTLRIDFERPIDFTAPVAREMILRLLEDVGADLPEIKTWTLSFDTKMPAVEMTGRFSVESMRKIISMGRPPKLSNVGASSANAPAPSPAQPQPAPTVSKNDGVAATQAYFRSVTGCVEGLKTIDRPTYRSTKLWYDRYAKQIEELPILGVDKEVLDWGTLISRTLREMSTGINYYSQNQKYTLASNAAGGYVGYYGYGYGVGGGGSAMDQSIIKKQSDSKMSVELDQRWQMIQISQADLRRKMTEKYQVEF